MDDAQQKFALNKYVTRYQEISMFGDRAGKRVFDRDHGGGNRSALHPVEYFGGARAGYNDTIPQHTLRSFVAERPEFALDGDFDGRSFHYMER